MRRALAIRSEETATRCSSSTSVSSLAEHGPIPLSSTEWRGRYRAHR
jgi:hypothetical protein